jgi:hypothetical protein
MVAELRRMIESGLLIEMWKDPEPDSASERYYTTATKPRFIRRDSMWSQSVNGYGRTLQAAVKELAQRAQEDFNV